MEATNADEFLSLIEEHVPDKLITSFGNVSKFAKYRWPEHKIPGYISPSFQLEEEAFPSDLSAWLEGFQAGLEAQQMTDTNSVKERSVPHLLTSSTSKQ